MSLGFYFLIYFFYCVFGKDTPNCIISSASVCGHFTIVGALHQFRFGWILPQGAELYMQIDVLCVALFWTCHLNIWLGCFRILLALFCTNHVHSSCTLYSHPSLVEIGRCVTARSSCYVPYSKERSFTALEIEATVIFYSGFRLVWFVN